MQFTGAVSSVSYDGNWPARRRKVFRAAIVEQFLTPLFFCRLDLTSIDNHEFVEKLLIFQ